MRKIVLVNLFRRFSWMRRRCQENLLVDDVSNTIGNENVRDDDLSGVEEDVAVVNSNLDRAALEGGNGLSILEGAAVAHSAVDNVVLQDGGELLSGQRSDQVGNGGEGTVLRGKDSDVLKISCQLSFMTYPSRLRFQLLKNIP